MGNVQTTGNTRSPEYVADASGYFYVRMGRSSGGGEYNLSVTLSDQNDAQSGGDLTFASPSPPPTPTLPPVEQENLTPPPFSGYKVLVTTGNKFGAGTDANVYITLYGKRGTSREILLDNPNRNDFEQGATDTFELRPEKVGNLGALEQIRIRHDNSRPLPGWYVVSVVIVDMATGQKYTFPLNRWLATDEGDGSISVVKEAVRSSKQIFTPPYSGKREWTHGLGNASSKAKANESTGSIAFYTDYWVGASTASAGQNIWVNTPQSVDLIVDGVIKYVGGNG
ncbi:MAG: PLAT/LH2 domain-containing protein [Candidatus Caldatribacteriaceae bacterium]